AALILAIPLIREQFVLSELDRRLVSEASVVVRELESGSTPEQVIAGTADHEAFNFVYQFRQDGRLTASPRLRPAPLATEAPSPPAAPGALPAPGSPTTLGQTLPDGT